MVINKDQALENLKGQLDQESWEWLIEQHPIIARRLSEAVESGARLDEIKALAWEHTRRPEFVKRIENATRHLLNEEQ